MSRFNGRGRKGVAVLTHKLGLMVQGCDEALARGPDPELATLRAVVAKTWQDLLNADMDSKHLLAEWRKSLEALDSLYASSRTEYFRWRSFLYAKLGHQAAPELAAFGVVTSPIGRKRPRRSRATPTG